MSSKSIPAIVITACSVLLLVVAATLPVSVEAQHEPRPTRDRPNSGGVQAVATAQAFATAVPNMQVTLQAAQASLQSTLQAVQSEIPLTIAAIQTQVHQVLEQMPTLEAVEVVRQGSQLHVTVTIEEGQIAEVLNAVVQAAGYSVSVSVDLMPDGAVITVNNITLENGMTGTLQLEYALAYTDGKYSFELVSVTLNNTTIPPEMVEDNIAAGVEVVLEQIMATLPDDLPTLPESITVALSFVTITDSEFIYTLILEFTNP